MNEDGLTALDTMGKVFGIEPHGVAAQNRSVPVTPSPVLHPLFFGREARSVKQYTRKFEQPWHRIALHLLSKGEDQKTVAELCQRTPTCIGQLTNTPWFQTMLAEEIKSVCGVGLVEQFQSDCALARSVENELLANQLTPPTVRASIAKTKIERVYGKAKQLVEFDNVTQSANPVAEVEELQRSIERDRAALFPAPSGQS